MIIKSMSRKEPSFSQLINYMSDIEKADEQFNVYHNLYARSSDGIQEEFKDNAKYVIKRKNGNYLYHEVLSITKAKNLDVKQQKVILREVAYQYIQSRASNNMVFGCLHDDHEDHLHYHLLISANEVGYSKKTRLSKNSFDQIKKIMEQRVLTNYPELEQKVVINKKADDDNEKLSRKGAEQKRRTGKTPQRDLLKEKLKKLFENANSKEVFFSGLSEFNLELYVRGKTIGVRDVENNRKYRLKTLGVLDEFNSMSKLIELDHKKTEQKNTNTDNTESVSNDQKKAEPNQKQDDPVLKEQARRKSEMEEKRKQESDKSQHGRKDKN